MREPGWVCAVVDAAEAALVVGAALRDLQGVLDEFSAAARVLLGLPADDGSR